MTNTCYIVLNKTGHERNKCNREGLELKRDRKQVLLSMLEFKKRLVTRKYF